MKIGFLISVLILVISLQGKAQNYYSHQEFCMGADLSYVNHIQDKGAVWRENGESVDPYQLFAEHGGNCARFRIWYDPQWTKQDYIDAGQEATQLYHDYFDVKEAIRRSKEQGLAVCLDFHYSDTWADPGKQALPTAWEGLTFNQVNDSLYAYTFRVLSDLDAEGLMPEYVQTGNEINPGFLFPHGKLSNSKSNLATLLNTAIQAVKDAGSQSDIKPKIIIHIAQPENVNWWFNQMIAAGVTGFDIIGFSYYPRWSDVPLSEISDYVSGWKNSFGKDVMCVETSYLWKTEGTSPSQDELAQMEPNYYPSVSGQKKYFIDLVREIIDGGGKGMMPWEPFWIKGQEMIDAWGNIGANWEEKSFFDYSKGNEVNPSINYMNYTFVGISGETLIADSVKVDIRLHVKSEDIQNADFYIESSLTNNLKVQLNKNDTVFTFEARLPENDFYVYRFYKNSQSETVPEIFRVGNTTDRAFSVPDHDSLFNLYWQHNVQIVKDSVAITFRVNMEGYTVHNDGMYIYGNFYGTWGPRMAMEKV
ncbi:MAG: glycosyl hydrolase 53 family protein, partial [Prolixibacteraceae bacterium]|nr:glycosyl hydrolase 53 family protein [Prolixibacteraceae bacterium]